MTTNLATLAPFALAPDNPACPASAAQRCRHLLAGLARHGQAFARRLRAARTLPGNPPNPRRRERANHLLAHAMLALQHIAILAARLADPAYRGEPLRPTRPPPASPPTSPPVTAPQPRRPRPSKPRPFEQRFAGRSVGQIIDHIRRNLGQHGRLAPLIDEQLARARPPTPPPPTRPAIRPPVQLTSVRPTSVPPVIAPTPRPHCAALAIVPPF